MTALGHERPFNITIAQRQLAVKSGRPIMRVSTNLLYPTQRHNVEPQPTDAMLTKPRGVMPSSLREAADGVSPGRTEMFGTANKIFASFVLLSFVTGCTSMRSLPTNDAQSIASQLKVGDKVQITRSDDSDVRFKTEVISTEGLAGDGIFVAYSDIQQIKIREHSTAKTVGLVVAILVVLKALADYADTIDTFGQI